MISALTPLLRHNLWKMQAIRLLFWMHFFSSVLVPFVRDWGGISFTQIFTLNAWFMFCNFLLEVPTGTIADRFGRKISLALGGFVAALGYLTYASVPRFEVFLLAELILAMSFTLMSGADEALVYDTLDELGQRDQAKRVFARLESFKLAGIISGALLGGGIAAALGLRAPMLLGAVPAVACGCLALTLKEPRSDGTTRSSRSYTELLRGGVRYFAAHATLRVLALDMIGSAALAWLIIWMYQPQLERVGIPLPFFGVVHAAMCVGQILVLSNMERVEEWSGGRRHYLVVSAVLPGIAYIGLAFAGSPIAVVAAVVLAAAVGLSRPVLFLGYMNEHIPSEQRATVLSTISMLRTLAVAVVNPLAGWVIDWQGGQTALLVFGVGTLALALFSQVEERHLQAGTPVA